MKISKTVKGRTVSCSCRKCVEELDAGEHVMRIEIESAYAYLKLSQKSKEPKTFVDYAIRSLETVLSRMQDK